MSEHPATYERSLTTSSQNPDRARPLKRQEPLENYPWSSYPSYLQPRRRRPDWLDTLILLGEYQITSDTTRGRRQFAEIVEERRNSESLEKEFRELRRGWKYGADDFLKRIVQRMSGKTVNPDLKRGMPRDR